MRRSFAFLVLALLVLTTLSVADRAPASMTLECNEGICRREPPPVAPSCTQCIPASEGTTVIRGLVIDPKGVPIVGASVYWTYAQTTTDAAGRYVIATWASKPVTLIATHPRHVWKATAVTDPLESAVSGVNVLLPYALVPSLSPFAVPRGSASSIRVDAWAGASVAGGRLVGRAGGTDRALAPVVSHPDGSSAWRGSIDVPPNAWDGTYAYSICILDAASPAQSCHGAPPGALMSEIVTLSYVVDGIAPTIVKPRPNGDGATAAPLVGATVTDPGPAGIDASSIVLTIDGAAVPATFTAASGSVSHQASSLAPGTHTARLVAADRAGNQTALSWQFVVQPVVDAGTIAASSDPSTCPLAGVALHSLNGRAVTVYQGSISVSPIPPPDAQVAIEAARFAPPRSVLYAEDLTFSWDRTAQTPESAYGLEVMRAGIPGDVASSGRPGIECAAADPNDLEPPRTVAGRSHQWGRFADSGGRATRIPSGTYSWRVRDAASTQSSPVDRFVVAGVEGIFDRYHDDVDEEIVYPVNRSPLKVAVAASSERGGQKPVPDGWLDTIVRGLDRWNGIEPSFSFAYDGRCAIVSVPTADPADCNEEIPRPFVQVRSLGERGPLAVTQVTWDRALSGTHFTTADGINLLQGAIVSINDSYAARLWLGANAPASGSYDLESIVAHELGHVAGLGHDYTFPAATMHYRLQEGAMHRIPQQFDRASLRFLYGQSHGGALMPYVKPLQIAEQAALIVRGSTSGTPTLRVASTGELYHEHRFVVAEYLKGTGPAEILVRTPLDSRGNPYEGAATLTTPVEQVLALSTETLGAMDMSPGSAYYVTYWSAGAWWISSDGFAINQADSTFAEPLADLRDRISAVVAGGPDPHPLPGIPRYVIA